ncbi:hypothetical protein ACFY7A_31240 [Streptomyces longwoodensis]|uniref:hypothetical protein n=1 Tax=Streptomyces longwoodensis TaxID=68231 RepID=UPI0036C79CB2
MRSWTTTTAGPLGDLLLVGEESGDGFTLTSLSMPGRCEAAAVPPGWRHDAVALHHPLPVPGDPGDPPSGR